jgi:hypothetical protein
MNANTLLFWYIASTSAFGTLVIVYLIAKAFRRVKKALTPTHKAVTITKPINNSFKPLHIPKNGRKTYQVNVEAAEKYLKSKGLI